MRIHGGGSFSRQPLLFVSRFSSVNRSKDKEKYFTWIYFRLYGLQSYCKWRRKCKSTLINDMINIIGWIVQRNYSWIIERFNYTEKTSPNFQICSSVRFFRYFWNFFGFFRSELQKDFKPFENPVTREVLKGQELPNNTPNAYKTLQIPYKSYYNQQELLNQNSFKPLKHWNYGPKLKSLEKMKKKKTKKKPKKNRKNSPKFKICYISYLQSFWLKPPGNVITAVNLVSSSRRCL